MFDQYVFRPRIGVFQQYSPRPLRQKVCSDIFNEIESWPTISVVTPSYNQGKYIEATIVSVLSQDYPGKIEYIIQDGGSTDDSLAVIDKYSSGLTFFESHKDKGQPNALNLGFSKTSGEIMAFINSDDIYLEGTFNAVAKWFFQHPLIDVIYSHRLIINSINEEIGKWILPPFNAYILKHMDYIPQETVFWRRAAWDKIDGIINEEFQFAFDWDLFLKFMKSGARIKRVPCFFSAFRYHKEQKTNACQEQLSKESAVIIGRLNSRSDYLSNLLKKKYFLESIGYNILDYLNIHI